MNNHLKFNYYFHSSSSIAYFHANVQLSPVQHLSLTNHAQYNILELSMTKVSMPKDFSKISSTHHLIMEQGISAQESSIFSSHLQVCLLQVERSFFLYAMLIFMVFTYFVSFKKKSFVFRVQVLGVCNLMDTI